MIFERWNVFIIIVFLVWGTMHPPLKILSNELPPFLINFLRFSIALMALVPFVVAQKKVPTKNDLWKIAALGVLGIALYGFLAVTGLHRSTAVNSSILLNSHPIITAIIAPFLLGERLHLHGVIGIILGFFGVILVVTNGFQLGGVFDVRYIQGNVLLFLSAVCLAVYAMYSKFFLPQYGSLVTTFWAVLGGTSVLFMSTLITGEITLIRNLSFKHALILLYLAIVVTAIAWVTWFKAIERIGVIRTETLFFLTPLSGIVSSAIFLGERITRITMLGVMCILAGVYMVQRKSGKNS
jgi:drug/metabolite transporter (DMT)-like permease